MTVSNLDYFKRGESVCFEDDPDTEWIISHKGERVAFLTRVQAEGTAIETTIVPASRFVRPWWADRMRGYD